MTEFDRKAAAWVRMKYPDANPVEGTVAFYTDCAAYTSGGWADIEVSWTEQNGGLAERGKIFRRAGSEQSETVMKDAWKEDLTGLIRELVEIEI